MLWSKTARDNDSVCQSRANLEQFQLHFEAKSSLLGIVFFTIQALHIVCFVQEALIFPQAHDSPVRAMVWSHADNWLLSSDHGGFIKYWQSNMNNVKMYEAHKEPIRGLRLANLVPGTQHNGLFLALLVGIVELIKRLLELAFVQQMNHVLFSSDCRENKARICER